LRISEDFIDHKIPNFKHQITNKSQISISNDRNIHLSCFAWIAKSLFVGYGAIDRYRRRIICFEF